MAKGKVIHTLRISPLVSYFNRSRIAIAFEQWTLPSILARTIDPRAWCPGRALVLLGPGTGSHKPSNDDGKRSMHRRSQPRINLTWRDLWLGSLDETGSFSRFRAGIGSGFIGNPRSSKAWQFSDLLESHSPNAPDFVWNIAGIWPVPTEYSRHFRDETSFTIRSVL